MVPPATNSTLTPSNPNSNNPQSSQQTKQLITKSYLDLIQQKFKYKTALPPGKERDQLVSTLTPAATNGVIIGTIQFFLLRRLPISWMNHMLRKKYPNGVPKNYNWAQNPAVRKPLMENQPPTYKPTFHPVTTPLSIVFDVTLSTVTASALVLGLVDQEKFLNVASSLPLGKETDDGVSPVSDMLCEDFVGLYKEQQKEIPRTFWKDSSNDVVMASIYKFVQNCKRRKAYEERLRSQGLLGAEEKVILPAGGVPDDVVIEDDDDSDENDDQEQGGDKIVFGV